LAVTTYLNVAQELGFEDPDLLDELPAEEREDKEYEMLELTTHRVFTNELNQEVVKALDKLRLRLKKSGQQAEAAKAAAVQAILSNRKTRDLWPTVGLVQGIIWRSIGAGFELMGASMEAEEADGLDGEKRKSEIFYEKMVEAFDRVPGLSGFLGKQVEQVWEKGSDAIFEGELYLGLFTPEEIEAGLDIFESSWEDDLVSSDEAPLQETESYERTAPKGPGLISRLDAYLTERFTPERLEQLRTRLDTLIEEAKFPQEWLPFISMVQESMTNEDVLEQEKDFLLQAFIGEMRYTNDSLDEETDEN
jgi:hypothetical protein